MRVRFYENENLEPSTENRRATPPDGFESVFWRPVGLSYNAIFRKLKKKYPDSLTRVSDIHRQASILRREGHELPHRRKARKYTYFTERKVLR